MSKYEIWHLSVFPLVFFSYREMARINHVRTSSVGRALKGATSRATHARILTIISVHLEKVGSTFSSWSSG